MAAVTETEIRRQGAGTKNGAYRRSIVAMDTIISITVLAPDAASKADVMDRVEHACAWFRHVENVCSRFDETSELRRLAARVGVPVRVSPTLFEATRFAAAVARLTDGAFDPTVGAALERRGFNRNYRTGAAISSLPGASVVAPRVAGDSPTYRDLRLDPVRRTITLRRPLTLDLGAVAKGLAIDLAARELAPLGAAGYAIDAGGDVFAAGHNADGAPWRVGVRHPHDNGALWDVLHVSDAAICTSGGYLRPSPTVAGEHHLLDPRTGHSPQAAASATVIAPTAMLADALATAAFVLGPLQGLRLLTRQRVEGLIVTSALTAHATRGWERYTHNDARRGVIDA